LIFFFFPLEEKMSGQPITESYLAEFRSYLQHYKVDKNELNPTKCPIAVNTDLREDGKVKYTYASQDYFKGMLKDGKINGFGALYYSDGERFEGHWKDDKPQGRGVHYFTNGDYYEADYMKGRARGITSYTNFNGESTNQYVTYTGQCINIAPDYSIDEMISDDCSDNDHDDIDFENSTSPPVVPKSVISEEEDLGNCFISFLSLSILPSPTTLDLEEKLELFSDSEADKEQSIPDDADEVTLIEEDTIDESNSDDLLTIMEEPESNEVALDHGTDKIHHG
jgi:hypothetical protein